MLPQSLFFSLGRQLVHEEVLECELTHVAMYRYTQRENAYVPRTSKAFTDLAANL